MSTSFLRVVAIRADHATRPYTAGVESTSCFPRSACSMRPLAVCFDVNETIMVGDPAGGDTFDDCLNKMLCKAAFVRPNPKAGEAGESAWTWHDGSPLDPARRAASTAPPPLLFDWEPPAGAVCFYKVPELKKPHAKLFALPGSPGVIYAHELERLRGALRWPSDAPPDPRLCQDGYQVIIPAFFHTLSELAYSRSASNPRRAASQGPSTARARSAHRSLPCRRFPSVCAGRAAVKSPS